MWHRGSNDGTLGARAAHAVCRNEIEQGRLDYKTHTEEVSREDERMDPRGATECQPPPWPIKGGGQPRRRGMDPRGHDIEAIRQKATTHTRRDLKT
jgi:hypothetical protein